MYCENCGASIDEFAKACPQCGHPVSGSGQTIVSASDASVKDSNPPLIWGILGMAFACTFFASVLGIIFSIIGLKKANAYNATYGFGVSNKVNHGRRLSIGGIIAGSILTVLFIVYICGFAYLVSRY